LVIGSKKPYTFDVNQSLGVPSIQFSKPAFGIGF
jgi:hypothetical protein